MTYGFIYHVHSLLKICVRELSGGAVLHLHNQDWFEYLLFLRSAVVLPMVDVILPGTGCRLQHGNIGRLLLRGVEESNGVDEQA